MKNFFVVSLMILAAGCANVLQTESIDSAYKQYEKENYSKTLRLISQTGTYNRTTPELLAELTYLKAQTYERMGLHEDAVTLYRYLKDQHQNSQYGYLAAKHLAAHDE